MGSTPSTDAADKKNTFDAEIAKALQALAEPGFRQTAARANWGLNGGVDQMVDAEFRKPEEELAKGYETANTASAASARQEALQRGGPYNAGALQKTITEANRRLQYERQAAETNMEMAKSQEKLATYNDFTNILNKETGTLFDVARGASANWGASIGGLRQTNPWATAAAGAATGAGAGLVFGPWGAVVGGVAGGAAGYFGGR